MQLKRFIGDFVVIAWATLCVALMFIGVGQQSGVQLAPLPDFRSFLLALADLDVAVYLLQLAGGLLGILLFSLAGLGIGGLFVGLLPRFSGGLEGCISEVATWFLVGRAILTIVLLASIVFTGGLAASFSAVIVVGGLMAGLVRLRHLGLYSVVRREVSRIWPLSYDGGLALTCALILTLSLAYSSTHLSYDAASQYFAYARHLADTQRFTLLSPSDDFIGSSLYSTAVYSAAIQLFGDQAARMYSWINGLTALAMGTGIAARLGITGRARWIFTALVLSSTAFTDLLGDGKIDLANLAVTLGAFYWIIRSNQDGLARGFILAGILAGLAIIVGPSGAIPSGAWILSYLVTTRAVSDDKSNPRMWTFMRDCTYLAVPAVLWIGTFLVVNQVVLSDALAPLSALRMTSQDWPMRLAGGVMVRAIALYPFLVTFGGIPDTLGFVSPLVVAFLPALAFKSIRLELASHRDLIAAVTAALVGLLTWLLAFGNIALLEVRYVLALWTILFLPMASVINSLIRRSSPSRHVVKVLLLIVLGFAAARVLAFSVTGYAPVASRNQLGCPDISACTFLEPINRGAAPGARVLVLSAYRYYLRSDLLQCSSTGPEYASLSQAAARSEDEFWREVQWQGYRFVTYDSYYNAYILRFRNLPDLRVPPDGIGVSKVFHRVFMDFGHRPVTRLIYEIHPVPGARQGTICVHQAGAWHLQTKPEMSQH